MINKVVNPEIDNRPQLIFLALCFGSWWETAAVI